VQFDLGDFFADLKGRRGAGWLADGRLVPYYDRAEIEHGALAWRKLELAWLADPIDLFFLQIQGSGRVRLPDGRVMRVAYAGQNGRPYVAIGRLLVERHQMAPEQVSAQSIRAWLVAHPGEAPALMDASRTCSSARFRTCRPTSGRPARSACR
jgi:membrane-bound lytic murein transglycosylase A